MLEYVIGDVNDAKQLFSTKEAIDLCDKEIAWLKSLRFQSKQEWREEDEKKIVSAKNLITMAIQNLLYLKDEDKAYQDLDNQYKLANEIVFFQELLSHFDQISKKED